MAGFLKKHLMTIILGLVFLTGACIMAYPTFSDWWNQFHQARSIANYIESVDDMSEETIEAMLEEAREYNERIAEDGIRFVRTEEEEEEYNSLLDVSGTGIMGYVQIPKIGVNLPIYHGVDESILQIAAGHIAGTSLPVGGENTHCVISGHRGLPSAKLLTDLDKITEGDIFTVTVLNQTLTYQVDQIRIVTPEDLSELQIMDGGDYVTLITCTPYSINSHRMLVRGKRIDNLKGNVLVSSEVVKISTVLVIIAICIPVLFLMLFILLIHYRKKPPIRTEMEWLEKLMSQEADMIQKNKRKGTEKTKVKKRKRKDEEKEQNDKE